MSDISADLYFPKRTVGAVPQRERYGPKVRWLRQGARLSGRELCRRTGITPSYLSDIETGRRLPAAAVSDRIADVLGVDRDALWRLALCERLSERDLRTLGVGLVWRDVLR